MTSWPGLSRPSTFSHAPAHPLRRLDARNERGRDEWRWPLRGGHSANHKDQANLRSRTLDPPPGPWCGARRGRMGAGSADAARKPSYFRDRRAGAAPESGPMAGRSSTLLLPPPGRAAMSHLGPPWTTLGHLGPLVSDHLGPLWTTLGRRRPEWAALERVRLRRTRDRPRQRPAAYAARPRRRRPGAGCRER